ncbi:FKBP-type peptidyl-prolyl cis-trans isomerase [archaeon]|nr:FKBP-type peptidyl-prolyl cis-trans isomerase [archaeon]
MMKRILLFAFLLLSSGCVSEDKDDDYSQFVLESEDFVKMDFTGKLAETGEVFDTSIADVAFNPDVKKTDTFTFADNYEPMSFTLGKGQVLPVLEAGLVGMKIGDVKTITLLPADAYGEWSSDYIVTLSRYVTLPKSTVVSLADFVEATGTEPELNETVQLNYWKSRVVDISEDNMTLLHEPEDNTLITTEYGPALVTLNDTHVTTSLTPEIDSVVVTSYGAATITDVNETHFTIDYNHPLASKTIQFEVTVVDIMKARSVKAQSITWTDYEAGISVAKQENLPAVVFISLLDCPACEALDNLAFSSPIVTDYRDEFVWIKVDGAANPQIVQNYGAESYPMIVMLNRAGEVSSNITGYIPPAQLRSELEAVFLAK